MFNTKLLYEEQPAILNTPAEILDILHENGKDILVLDQTPFNESDTGIIESESKLFHVERVSRKENTVYHEGSYEGGSPVFEVNEKINCSVDEDNRMHQK